MILRFFISLLLLCSCSNNNKSNIKILQSKPIIFPLDLKFNSATSKNIEVSDKLMKMLIYYDSTECSSCAVNRLFLWESIIYNLHNVGIEFYFIFRPKLNDIDYIKEVTKIQNYSIWVDSLGYFEKLNPHLSKNKAMHAFLLDENNNVILVGNPLNNNKIEKLLYIKAHQNALKIDK